MDDTLSNKIAAGEVVERPASIVKELVENAIDADSTVIEIALEEAGLLKIRVTDNGKGMSEQDAVRAFERHATSKISNEHDLFRIRTLGFRGEALASIASVSKIDLWTSDGESTGTEVHIDGGQLVKHEKAAFRKGTDMTVSQLFFNTPARLKYMKTIQTELGHTIGLVNRLALSHPNIAFKLTHHSQTLLQTTGSGDQLRVISDIYGMAVARKMVPFKGENADYAIHGFVTLPEMTRASRNYMTTIVNGRWIQSHAINRVILDAFHTFLPIGRFPIAVINIDGDPFLTDVNVHPSKQQIRMSKESELLTLIQETIQQAVRGKVTIPGAVKKESPKQNSEQTSLWANEKQEQQKNSEPVSTSTIERKAYQSPGVPTIPSSTTTTPPPKHETIYNKTEKVEHADDEWVVQESEEPVVSENNPYEEPVISSTKQFPMLFPVGQVHGTYIIAQNEDGFYMIDQHAAQERIKYEFFRDKLKQAENEERQLLLLPLQFHYSTDEKVKIEENKQVLEDVGIFLEEFGPTSYIVREFPTWFPTGEETAIIEEIIEQVLHTRKVDIGKLREEAAIMMSCKRSIKANHHLTVRDMEILLNDLGEAENPFTCPHGRPVLIHFTTYEIEKMFKRVM
ncbi:DNA mismatch repair protein MutL [Sporosarcina ureilytica]|uniref:DNA mismatch repair protein MutL n=2 Tax=Sporosarcina ureilytica TaxID=298596 RepID=A0A1D8JKI9_9BACL|nr:DNA mismatch repair protein MutL [Sporosarcina ureilytica]